MPTFRVVLPAFTRDFSQTRRSAPDQKKFSLSPASAGRHDFASCSIPAKPRESEPAGQERGSFILRGVLRQFELLAELSQPLL